MNKLISIIISQFMIIATLIAQPQSEEQAIRELVVKTSKSFHNLDFDTYQEVWLHEPYVMRMNPEGWQNVGWDSLSLMYRNMLKNDLRKWDDIRIEITDMHHHITGNTAWVINDQTELGLSEGEPESYSVWAIRFLEKVDGEWKHAFYMTGNYPESDEPNIQEQLNQTAYSALESGMTEQAREIFATNIKLYPQSSEAHTGMAEALLKEGKKQEAVKHLMMAIKINPNNEKAKELKNNLD